MTLTSVSLMSCLTKKGSDIDSNYFYPLVLSLNRQIKSRLNISCQIYHTANIITIMLSVCSYDSCISSSHSLAKRSSNSLDRVEDRMQCVPLFQPLLCNVISSDYFHYSRSQCWTRFPARVKLARLTLS